MDKRDFYEVLEVPKNSTQKEIKSAFKKLAKKYHPDISKEANAKEKFQEIQEAYSVLGDEQKRAQYDQYGHAAFDQMGGGGYQDFDFGDIFSEIFGGGFGGFGGGFGSQRQDPNAPRQGKDMEISIMLEFKESVFGVEKTYAIKREQDCHKCHGKGAVNANDVQTCSTCQGRGKVQQQQRTILGMAMTESICPDCKGVGKKVINPCSECHGSGRHTYSDDVVVKIPAGVENGAYMRVPGKGQGGINGGPAGDLFLNISVKEDNFFKRDGLNIRVEIPISYSQAVLGATIDVPTIHGEVAIKIPAGTQSGTLLRAKGKGVQGSSNHFGSRNIGDQLIKVVVKIPNKISSKEKDLIEQLSNFDDKHTDQKGLFSKIKDLFN